MLAAGVAHELNNPLAYITANVGFAIAAVANAMKELREIPVRLGASPVPASVLASLREVAEALADTREGTERAHQLVRDLKTFSRNDVDDSGPVDLHRVLEASINIGWNEIRQRARLVKDFGEVPPVQGNESRLGQVFLNLLINAAQAMTDVRAEKKEIRVTTRSESDKVIVEVRDTGCGIPSESLSNIFEPFFTTKPAG